MKLYYKIVTLIGAILIFNSCQDFEADLEKTYTASPTLEATASQETALKSFQFWYDNVNAYYGTGLMLTTMADMNTCSWGNGAMRDMSSEPRVAWDNNPGYSYAKSLEDYYNSMYALLANQTLVVKALKGGTVVADDPAKVECLARFGQAAGIGYIALVHDKVWLSDETGVLFNGEPGTPTQAIEVALQKLDIAIDLAMNNSFTVTEINGMTMSNVQFAQFLNSFAARLIVNSPRNKTQRDALDWGKVLDYANNGLTFDVSVLSDGWVNWYNEWAYYSIYPGWGRIDLRVIHLMDPNYPDYFTEPSGLLPAATSSDLRLTSDFQYLTSQDFIPSRGIYHFSSYRHKRYDLVAQGSGWTGAIPEFLKAENDLYKAEAILRSGGSLTAAANVINTSSRVLRGGLPPVAANQAAIEAAIHYERSVELLTTGMGLGFFEMRRNDLLQKGTPLHLPVPGSVLLAGGYENYTFGGVANADGINTSNGGWR